MNFVLLITKLNLPNNKEVSKLEGEIQLCLSSMKCPLVLGTIATVLALVLFTPARVSKWDVQMQCQ